MNEKKRNSSRPNLRKLPNGFVLHSTGMDSEDYFEINRHLRGFPLSEEEKIYVDEIYYGLMTSIDIFNAILDTQNISEDMRDEIMAYVKQAEMFSKLNSNVIGRGYSLKMKEVKNEK